MKIKESKLKNYLILIAIIIAASLFIKFSILRFQTSNSIETTERNYSINDIFGNQETEVADSYFKNKDYELAILEYQKLIKNSERNSKYIVSYSLLFQAQSFYEINDPETAKIILTKLSALYPNTVPAQVGSELFKAM